MPISNRVTLIGNIGQDPESGSTANGKNYARFSVATNERYKDRDGEMRTKTSWHRCIAWGKTSEIIAQYMTKGDEIRLEGKLSYGSYEKNGQKFHTTDIVVESFEFGQRAKTDSGASDNAPSKPNQTAYDLAEGIDDLPF